MKDSGISWLGQVPEHWTIYTLYQLSNQVRNKNVGLKENNLLSLSYGKIKRKDIDSPDGLLPASFDGYNIIQDGDIVLRLTDLQNDHTSLRVGLASEKGIITSAYTTVRPFKNEYSKILYYILHSFDLKKGFYGMGFGVRQSLNYSEVKGLKVVFPEENEISKITEYLDRQVNKIDSEIALLKDIVLDYQALMDSFVYETLTKGIDPSVGTRESGFFFIKSVPLNAKVMKLKNIVDISDGTHDTPEYVDEGENTYPLVTSRCIENGHINVSMANHISKEDYEKINQRSYVEKYDVIMPMIGTVGNPAIVDTDEKFGIKNVGLFRTHGEEILGKYVVYLLNSSIVKTQFSLGQRGGVQNFVSQDKLKNLQIIVPDNIEDVVGYLDRKCIAIQTMLDDKLMLISDLENYKRSLIYEVATGKRKVV